MKQKVGKLKRRDLLSNGVNPLTPEYDKYRLYAFTLSNARRFYLLREKLRNFEVKGLRPKLDRRFFITVACKLYIKTFITNIFIPT